MSFVRLILKGLARRRTRTSLTVLGIAAGIATVVALGAITEGMRGAASGMIRLGGSDFMVAQKGASDLSFSTLDESDLAAIRAVDGVTTATGVLLHITRVGSNPYFVLYGVAGEDLALVAPPLTEGAATPGTILLGRTAADALDARVGGAVTIAGHPFRVGGIYVTGRGYEDGGGFAPLADVQAIAARPGIVTSVYVRAAGDATAVAARVAAQVPGVVTVTDSAGYSQVDQGMELLDAANLAISLLAVGIGAIGVMNTMIMSVFERTRELGVLRAVGWSRRRVVALVLGESVTLCLGAAVVGTLLGWLGARAVGLAPAVGGLLQADVQPATLVRAVGIALFVALAGAAYPAIRAIRMTPIGALRHE